MWKWSLVAVGLCLIAPATAQGLDVVDPAGDEAASTPAGMVGTGGQYPHADLLGYSIGPDTPDAFPILIQLAHWQNQFGYEPDGEGRIVALHFRYADLSYRVVASSTCEGGFGLESSVDASPGTVGGWDGRACLNGTVDANAGLATIIVPKQVLADATGEPVFAGARLTETFAHVRDTTSTGVSFAAPTLIDRAPDTGFGPELVFQYGLQNDGTLGLTTDVPIRWSNGEPSTFVYGVTLHNRGEAGTFIVSSTDVPEGWRVVHPQLVHLEADAALRVPVVLTTESRHVHGGTAFFTLAAHANDGGSNASIPLGIHYPAIAQPAGHHPILYFHSAEGTIGSRPVPWMNTLADDPSGSGDPPVKHMGAQYDPTGQTYVQWGLAMNPPLRMGLDFRTEEPVRVHLEFQTDAPTTAEEVYVRLLYCDPLLEGRSQLTACPGADVVLAAGSASMSSLTTGESAAVDLDLPLLSAADRLPFREGSQLGVHVQVNATGAAPFVGLSMLMDPAEVRLPLNEYRDDVPLELSRGELLLTVDRSERRASPGTTVVAGVEIRNEGSATVEVSLLAEGVQRDWAQFSQEAMALKPGDTEELQVAIRVPEDAVVGQVHEFLVIAQSAHGGSSVAPLRVEVVAEPTEDEAHLFRTPGKEASWPGIVAIAALGLAAGRRRSA